MRDIDLSVWELDRALMYRVEISHISMSINHILDNVMYHLTPPDNVVHGISGVLSNIHPHEIL